MGAPQTPPLKTHLMSFTFKGAIFREVKISKIRARHDTLNIAFSNSISGLYRLEGSVRPGSGPPKSTPCQPPMPCNRPASAATCSPEVWPPAVAKLACQLLRGSGEGWASAFLNRAGDRSFFGHLRPSSAFCPPHLLRLGHASARCVCRLWPERCTSRSPKRPSSPTLTVQGLPTITRSEKDDR